MRAIAVLVLVALPADAFAQELLDRVVARVGGTAITLTDARAAVGLGLVEVPAGADPTAEAVAQLIDRQIVLSEVARFPQPQPAPERVTAAVAAMRAAAADDLDALMESTGFDGLRITQAARDSVRIEEYLDQRFGTSLPVSDEDVARYYAEHPGEFTQDGALLPLAEVEAEARVGAAAARRQELIDDWIATLRTRAEVIVLEP